MKAQCKVCGAVFHLDFDDFPDCPKCGARYIRFLPRKPQEWDKPQDSNIITDKEAINE